MELQNLKVALVHDYLREYGGAERVLEALHEIFPHAPLYTAYYSSDGLGVHKKRFADWDIHTSWLQKLPGANRLVSPFRIFAPAMFESFDLSSYDLVISSTSVYFAKAVVTSPNGLHISYIHTPPRYLYGYATSFNYKKNPVTRILGEMINHFLRVYDYQISQRPDILVANSENVARRIKKFYRRDSVVIYPSVDIEQFKKTKVKKKGNYYLVLSRLVRGKGVDVIVKAFTSLNLPLKIAGSGPELEELKSIAGKNIEFLGQVSDPERIELYSMAKVLVLASEDEDFGITAVEAQAAGIPVIAPRSGGFIETVVDGKTGKFYDKVDVEHLVEAVKNFAVKDYKSDDCVKQAEKFSKDNFKKHILDLIKNNIK